MFLCARGGMRNFVHIPRVWQEKFRAYGAHKTWKQPNREQIPVAHCTARRLMHKPGLCGAKRGKAFKVTTIAAPDATLKAVCSEMSRELRMGPNSRSVGTYGIATHRGGGGSGTAPQSRRAGVYKAAAKAELVRLISAFWKPETWG